MIQCMLAIWSLVPLPFLNPAWTSGSSRFTYCWREGSKSREWSKSQVGGIQKQKRLGEKGLSAQQFDFEGRTDRAEREGTTVPLVAANCRRPERAGMELPVLNDQLPMKVKGDPRPQRTLLTESGVRRIIHRNSKIAELKSSACQSLCYHVEMLQLAFYPPPSPNLPLLTSAESPNWKIHFQNFICHLTGHPTLNS